MALAGSAEGFVAKRAFNLSRSAGVTPVTTRRVLFVVRASCPVVDKADGNVATKGDNVTGGRDATLSVGSVSEGVVAGVPKGKAERVALSRLTPALSPIFAMNAFKSVSDRLARLCGKTRMAAPEELRCAELCEPAVLLDDGATDPGRDVLRSVFEDPAKPLAPAGVPTIPFEREFKIASNSPAMPFGDVADDPPDDSGVDEVETADDTVMV